MNIRHVSFLAAPALIAFFCGLAMAESPWDRFRRSGRPSGVAPQSKPCPVEFRRGETLVLEERHSPGSANPVPSSGTINCFIQNGHRPNAPHANFTLYITTVAWDSQERGKRSFGKKNSAGVKAADQPERLRSPHSANANTTSQPLRTGNFRPSYIAKPTV